MEFGAEDRAALRDAVRSLEYPNYAARIANLIGSPIEATLKRLPQRAQEGIQDATQLAIAKCLDVALRSLETRTRRAPADALHRFMAGVSGAVGGAGGFLALPVELPVSTVIMLRSIASIAASEGEDLSQVEPRLSCLEVFALGGRTDRDNAGETAYYVVRAALTQAIREAAAYISERGIAERGAPVLVRLIASIASRFGIVVSEKAAAQAVPMIGAAAGAAVNLVFTEHFQNMAHGHFTIRRLERKYGPDLVRRAYEREKDLLDGA
ncbi:MAG: EcsC family protein [Bryobacterales bacterium]|nr:EcsC family protein [Bryobacterales bacterium]